MSIGPIPSSGVGGQFDFNSLDFQQGISDFFPGIVYVYEVGSGKLKYVNKKITDILGYSSEDISSWDHDFKKVVFKDDEDLVQKELAKFNELADEQRHSYQCRFTKKDGEWLHFEVSGKILRRDKDGRPSTLLLIAQNINDQIKRSQELAALQELAEDNEELLQFGNWTWDPKTDSLRWSKGMYTLMDLATEDKLPKLTFAFYLDHIPQADQESIRQAISAAESRTRQTVEFKYKITTDQKQEKIFYSKGKVIYGEDKKISKIIGTTRDVTQIGKYEIELERRIEQLDQSNQELEDFAYAASHDLQEPLRKISTISDRLQLKFREQLPEEGKSYVDRIRVAVKSAQSLIESLMEFSRITHINLDFENTSLESLIEQVKSDLELKIEETGAEIRSSNLPTVEVSGLQIKQLFNNLFLNSIKFRKDGQAPVIKVDSRLLKTSEVKKFLLDENMPHYLITVKDNGIGFEEVYSTIIFRMFSRLHGKSEYPGAGIGLALCKKIVESHNGIIFAHSVPGEGSVFSIILPAKKKKINE